MKTFQFYAFSKDDVSKFQYVKSKQLIPNTQFPTLAIQLANFLFKIFCRLKVIVIRFLVIGFTGMMPKEAAGACNWVELKSTYSCGLLGISQFAKKNTL